LCLLNNLEGSGEAGQFTAENVQAVLNTLLGKEGFVLADAPLGPRRRGGKLQTAVEGSILG